MRPARILFTSYWSLGEPLTASMVLPYLRSLAARADVEHIKFVTIESSGQALSVPPPVIPKTTHTALAPRTWLPRLAALAELNLRAAPTLARSIRKQRLDLAIAASSMAGAPTHVAAVRTRIPYAVYCFEPHADYMAECGVWKKNSLRYRVAKRMEGIQCRNAMRILTVTENYRRYLAEQGVPAERLRSLPCAIDTDAFRPSADARRLKRDELGIPGEATVGVYAGKFGGLYLDDAAFTVFSTFLRTWDNSFILVLSTMDPVSIRNKARRAGIPDERLLVRRATYPEMPAYLAAADVAFSTVRPGPSKKFQCPVKNGEYWAAGLPILMTDGIGDDHLLMRQGIGGAVFAPDLTDLADALERIRVLVNRPTCRAEMIGLAGRTRALSLIDEAFNALVTERTVGQVR